MKSLHLSVEESLKKLQTSYIDILYVHWVSELAVMIRLTRSHDCRSGTTRPA